MIAQVLMSSNQLTWSSSKIHIFSVGIWRRQSWARKEAFPSSKNFYTCESFPQSRNLSKHVKLYLEQKRTDYCHHKNKCANYLTTNQCKTQYVEKLKTFNKINKMLGIKSKRATSQLK